MLELDFKKFLLNEAPGGPPGGGMSSPGALPPGGPSGGMGGPPMGGLGGGMGGPPMGGLGGGLGGPPMGGDPNAQHKPINIQPLNVWEVVEKILSGKDPDAEKKEKQQQPQPPQPPQPPMPMGGMGGPSPLQS